MQNFGRTTFQLAYELSPIILTGGLAEPLGGFMPIVSITEAGNFGINLLNGDSPLDPDNFFAHFSPLQGCTLIQNDIGDYPFANQTIAANAIITRPLKVSMVMTTPVNKSGGYSAKMATMTTLKTVLDKHCNLGGTFIVATPSFIYRDTILAGLHDVSRNDTKQVQNAWQFDFEKPLLTQNDAAGALSSLMSKLSAGVK